jgi:hypothetical protein
LQENALESTIKVSVGGGENMNKEAYARGAGRQASTIAPPSFNASRYKITT